MVEGRLSKTKMQQNIEDYDRMLNEFEEMFMKVPGELDYSRLKTQSEIRELDTLHGQDFSQIPKTKRSLNKIEVCD